MFLLLLFIYFFSPLLFPFNNGCPLFFRLPIVGLFWCENSGWSYFYTPFCYNDFSRTPEGVVIKMWVLWCATCIELNCLFEWLLLFLLSLCSKSNETDNYSNDTQHSTTVAVKPTTPTIPTPKPILPVQTGVKAQEEEQSSGLTIFFSLLVIGQ